MSSQCGATTGRTTRGPEGSFEARLGQLVYFPQTRKLIGIAMWAQFAGNAHWAESSPLFAYGSRPTPLKCKNCVPGACTKAVNCIPSSYRLYRMGVSQAQKAKDSGDERPQLRAS